MPQTNLLFELGSLFITRNAQSELSNLDVLRGIRRHMNGDWGDLCSDDKRANDSALKFGGRLFSAYHAENGTKFWVITEDDRSMSTVLLPDDY